MKKELVYLAVLHDEAPPEEIVGRVFVQGLAWSQVGRPYAEWPRDIGLCRIVCHTEFLTRGAEHIPRLAAVGEVYHARLVVEVIGDVGYAAAFVGNQRITGTVLLMYCEPLSILYSNETV